MSAKLTIKDIAVLANTSKTTVSFYLNGKTDKMSAETKARIKAVIKEHNYQPSVVARSLNAKSMKLIGVIIGDITNSFSNHIVKGIDEIAKANKYQLIVGNSSYDFKLETDYVKRMIAMGVDGFIVQPTIEFERIEKEIRAAGKPIVFIDSQSSTKKTLSVKTNNYEAVKKATEILVNKGYNNFICVSADPSVLSTRMERTTGFENTLQEHGFESKRLCVTTDSEVNEIKAFLDANIDFNKKTLVFVANCWALPKVFMALEEKRSFIPNYVGLLGFDNIEWTQFSMPKISTIVQPAYEEGIQSCKILLDAIEDTTTFEHQQVLECTINCLDSTNI